MDETGTGTFIVQYEFLVKTPELPDGIKVTVNINVANQLAARHKVSRLYPTATSITFIRSKRNV